MIILDTHIWVDWIICGSDALPVPIVEAIQAENRLAISTISCFEVSHLVKKGKLELPLHVDE